MSTDASSIRTVSWRDVCPWLILLRTFRPAIGTQLLLLALLGAVASSAGWRLAALAMLAPADLDNDPGLEQTVDVLGAWPGALTVATGAPVERGLPRLADQAAFGALHPMVSVPVRFAEPFRRLFDPNISWHRLAYYLAGGLWTLLVWSFFGGAITRVAGVRLGREERVGLRAAVNFSRSKLGSYFAAPILPLLGMVLLAIPLVALGWLMRLDAGVVVAGICWLLVLLDGFLIATMALGLLFGWPLMWSTISTEGSDAFDAISRSYAYTMQRPLQYLFYATVAVVFGLLGWVLVWFFAEGVIALAYWGISWGAGAERLAAIQATISRQAGDPGPGTSSEMLYVGAWFIRFFVGAVRALAHSFAYSYFWCATAAIYLLLRRDADQTEMDDVYLEEDEEVSYGLPPLEADASGVPGVADEGPTTATAGEVEPGTPTEDRGQSTE
jgi:hypothetical protein